MFCVCPHMCVCFSEYDICRVPLSGSEKVVIRIFSRRHYAATQAELPFQGVRCLLFKSFPSITRLPQKLNSLFRDRDFFYSNLFQAPLCYHKGRVPLSGMNIFVSRIYSTNESIRLPIFPFRDREVFIRIFSRRHYAATLAELLFQGVIRLLFKSFPGTTMPPQRQGSLFRDRDVFYSNLFQAPLCYHKGRVPL